MREDTARKVIAARSRFGVTLRLLHRFARRQHGSIAINFAMVLIPISLAVGAAVDFSFANNARTRLNAIADAAALAAVGQTAQGQTAADAQQFALQVFNTQTTGLQRVNIKSVSVKVVDNKVGRTAVVKYDATTNVAFMGIANIKHIKISGDSTAASRTPTYIDFYLLLDNTPSMGVGATTADINTLVANTPDQCAFACHDLSAGGSDYYSLAKKLGVQMRIDVLRQATQKLMDTAQTTQAVASQFRVAIYTHGTSCTSPGLSTIASLTSDLANAKTSASAIDLMTIPNQGYNNDQCTDTDTVLSSVNSAINTPGDGKLPGQPQKVLFYVTDGVADLSKPNGCSKPVTGTRCQQPIDVSYCDTMKKRGVRIAVLYTTYLPLPTNDWYNTWVAPFQSQIGSNLQTCASPGLYFEVSPTQGIADAMLALFAKTVGQPRLTQ
jgi:Flp pilus assembly protein TadG